METKLTLRINEELIHRAKDNARLKGVSLSRMVADYFKTLRAVSLQEPPESPVLSEIMGILSQDIEEKKFRKGYRKHLSDKYL